MNKKNRISIPSEVADQVLFASDRCCCVCRNENRPVQIHHIDENPSNNSADNLAVLCTLCHDLTQLKGGFGRKLNAGQVKLYRDEWYEIVKSRRSSSNIARGGDGGQIFIFTKKMSGNGSMSVNGGDGQVGGNAGKIHIEAEENEYIGKISANGGKSIT